ncbi:MAG: FAD-binding oxidoreductase [Candidatus Eisenbacteria bacterium]|uniref:FAD-binding oxidoreductase n=1 Tax=Eiseniibacteriota bacterium TaxID=2212470 RepID=A0A849SJ38_UNCEI|nr:FAD-binding oxidoreductase [Candidatus Eisenbacteria bacterium]
MESADIVIVGGGVMGSSIAWHLCEDGVRGRVVVIERDPSYARASSRLALGGVRQQFGSDVNIRLVQWSVRFWRQFDDLMSVNGHEAHANFRSRGYLFLADDAHARHFEERLAMMRLFGAQVERLELDEIAKRVPGVALDDIRFGVFGADDGYANPHEVLHGFRAGAQAAGAEFRTGEVVAIESQHARVREVQLADGTRIATRNVVIAAGAWSRPLGAMLGVEFPIEPQRQSLFRCALPERASRRFPMVIDPSGVHWRHEDDDRGAAHDAIVVACTRAEEPMGENFEPDPTRWSRDFLPALARRLPGLRGLEPLETWAGLYEMTPDHNPLIGACDTVGGLYVAAGFSGHGLMMSPAVGKAMSEIVRLGRAETVDVSPLSPDRFERGALFRDGAMI